MAMSVFERFYQFALDDRDWSELCHTVFFFFLRRAEYAAPQAMMQCGRRCEIHHPQNN